MSIKRHVALVAALLIAGAALGAPAIAKRDGERGKGHGKTRPAATKMRFKLDSHQWDVGAEVTGSVRLRTRDGKKWGPFEGATLSVLVDGTECATLTTDAEGGATAACGPAEAGEHVMRVRYEGDDAHKRAKRAQGYQVGADEGDDDGDEDEDDDDDLVPAPDPSPSPTI